MVDGGPTIVAAHSPGGTSPRAKGIIALTSLLAIALAIRSLVVLEPSSEIHPDELFQYLEQGHRLAFGSGVIPWEYDYGTRSWLLPGLIASFEGASSWISASPLLYVCGLRLIAAICSLVVVAYGFREASRKVGLAWATITGFFCAVWFHAVFFSPSLLTEVLASYLLFPAVYLASSESHAGDRRPYVLGLLLALVFCLRIQTAPALLLIACWYGRSDFRKWGPLVLSASATIAIAAGILDYFTWGAPFHSVWQNFYLNGVEGVSRSFGQLSALRYLDYLTAFWSPVALPLACLVFIGCFRAPLLAATCLVILITHSFFAHKEYRFVAFVFLSLPVFIGLGCATVFELLRQRTGEVASVIFAASVTIGVPIISWYGWNAGFPVQYLPNKGVLRAFVAAHDERQLCGLGVADFLWSLTGGYTYLNRNAPLYYSESLTSTSRPGYYNWGPSVAGYSLTMHVVLAGKTLPQFPGSSLLKHTAAFNYLIASKGHPINGYTTVKCFPNDSGVPDACLLRREGACLKPVESNTRSDANRRVTLTDHNTNFA